MSSKSATLFVVFIVAIVAFCIASVFAAMTGEINILPNNQTDLLNLSSNNTDNASVSDSSDDSGSSSSYSQASDSGSSSYQGSSSGSSSHKDYTPETPDSGPDDDPEPVNGTSN